MYFSKKFKKIKKIQHCFFSRKKGFSKGIYSSLNCGLGSKDKKLDVNKNLNKISKIFGIDDNSLKTMLQTHSSNVIFISRKNVEKRRYKADALVTKINNIALGVLTADCVPILLYDSKKQIIGCIHAGWKGVFKNIIKKTIAIFKKNGSNKNHLMAAVGPCISKFSYEVDSKFKKKFVNKSKNNFFYFKKKGNKKYFFDLRLYVNHQLKICGIKKVDNINLDTFKKNNSFFSYRRSKLQKDPDYGRCISVIKLN